MTIIRARRARAVVVAVALSLPAAPAAAAGAVRVALLPFEGPSAPEVQAIVEAALPPDCAPVPPEQVERLAPAIAGLRGQSGDTPDSYAAIGRRLRAGLLVEGEVFRDDRWRARLAVRRATTGIVVGRINWSGTRIPELLANAERGARFWLSTMVEKSGAEPSPGAVGQSSSAPARRREVAARSRAPSLPELQPEQPAPPPPPAPAATVAEADDDDPFERARPRAAPRAPLWEISVGPRSMSRTFIFTDNISGLPGYSLPAAPGVSGEIELFPGARSNSPMGQFGFSGYWETSIGARTIGRDGVQSQSTSLGAYRGGIRYRFLTGAQIISLGADYGEHRFQLDLPDAIAPNVKYTFLRPSLTGRFTAGKSFSITLSGAYLHVMTIGALADATRFPRATAVGAEFGAALGYALDDSFELRIAADLRHYAHDMHARPGDPLIAGGAMDEHFGAALLLTYRLR